jgi:predicted FMN-binding regulatory protein PaiB
MYVPKLHEELDIAVLHALIKAHPLGAWVIQSDGELVVNHIPLLLDANRGKYGTLAGHVAKANAAWKSFSITSNSIVIFQGVEIPIDKLVGKWKVDQDSADADKLGVVAGLMGRGDSPSKEMAALVRKHVAVAAER